MLRTSDGHYWCPRSIRHYKNQEGKSCAEVCLIYDYAYWMISLENIPAHLSDLAIYQRVIEELIEKETRNA